MASSSIDFSPEPDLHPLYPSTTYIASLLTSHSGLAPAQRAELVAHSLARACVFGELIVLQYLLADPQAQIHIDLGTRDEDGLGLVSLAIHGFGAESDRDVEREECVRLLIAQGADLRADKGDYFIIEVLLIHSERDIFKPDGRLCIMLRSSHHQHLWFT